MNTVLITGTNGFVGCYTIEELLHNGYKVVATGKGPLRLPLQHGQLIYESMDFTQPETVKVVFEKYKPATIIHCGALSKPDDCEQNKEAAYATNVTGTIHLLNEASVYKSFFIFLSTDFIFSGEEGMYSEEDAPAPVNYYGQTKLLAEEEVKKYPFPWSIVRTILVYGNPKGSRSNILTSVADALKTGKPLRIYDDQVRTPTHVADLAKAIVTIADKKKAGIYHISGNDVQTPYSMACAVARYFGMDETIISRETAETFKQSARRPLKTGFNLAKARRELSYVPISFEEGVRKTFDDRPK